MPIKFKAAVRWRAVNRLLLSLLLLANELHVQAGETDWLGRELL